MAPHLLFSSLYHDPTKSIPKIGDAVEVLQLVVSQMLAEGCGTAIVGIAETRANLALNGTPVMGGITA